MKRPPWGQHARVCVILFLAAVWIRTTAARGGWGATPGVVREHSVAPADLVIHDGDTVALGGEVVRLLGIDTPEKAAPWFRGDQEPWASRATDRVRALVHGAGRVVLRERGARDAHGRLLGHLLADGRPVAVDLVAEGLAYPTVDRFGDGGFPALADAIAAAARPPAFEAPWRWRRRQRR